MNWNTETPETFSLLSRTWDVREAKKILTAKPHKTTKVDVTGLAALVGRPGVITNGVYIDWDLAKTVDLSVPLILVTFSDGSPFPIDGWHRIARAKLEGIEELPCVVLTKKETKKVTVGESQ